MRVTSSSPARASRPSGADGDVSSSSTFTVTEPGSPRTWRAGSATIAKLTSRHPVSIVMSSTVLRVSSADVSSPSSTVAVVLVVVESSVPASPSITTLTRPSAV